MNMLKNRLFSTSAHRQATSPPTRYGLLYLLLAHHPPCQLNRTFRIRVGGKTVDVCSRCLGQWFGFLSSLIWGLIFMPVDRGLAEGLLVFGLLPLPVAVDWSTQTLGLRESTNLVRVLTGLLYGVALAQYVVSVVSRDWMTVITATSVFVCYMLVFWLVVSRPGVATSYLKPYEEFIHEQFSDDRPA